MDASTAISAATFFRMLARLVPTGDGRSMPWDAIPWRPRIHLGLFVHRVTHLAPGLYALARDPEKIDTLRQIMRRDFVWLRPPSWFRVLRGGSWTDGAAWTRVANRNLDHTSRRSPAVGLRIARSQ
jgi:hypothetical protein